jgi:Zn-finger nucleic acid-binding protein
VDLTGRAEGYRGAAIRCPGCGDPMTIEGVDEAEVDVCGSCGGLWVDWFDGEIRRVAGALLRGEQGRGSSPSPAPPAQLRNEPRATGACPRCARQLAVERYAVKADAGGAADLLRCEECAGLFVPRTSAALLATLPLDEEPPGAEAEGPAILEPLPWQRLLQLVRRLLGL